MKPFFVFSQFLLLYRNRQVVTSKCEFIVFKSSSQQIYLQDIFPPTKSTKTVGVCCIKFKCYKKTPESVSFPHFTLLILYLFSLCYTASVIPCYLRIFSIHADLCELDPSLVSTFKFQASEDYRMSPSPRNNY